MKSRYSERQRFFRQEAAKRYREKNPHVYRTWIKFRDEVASGRIKRGECEFCNTTEKAQGHHEDYDKPFDVIWLCQACHTKWHIAKKVINEGYKGPKYPKKNKYRKRGPISRMKLYEFLEQEELTGPSGESYYD